jgi:kynureninase
MLTSASGEPAGATDRTIRSHPLARYRDEFPIFRDRIYLNTCSLGALGERTRRKVAAFLDVWQARGAAAWYDVWWDALGDLRRRYGRLIGAAEGGGGAWAGRRGGRRGCAARARPAQSVLL